MCLLCGIGTTIWEGYYKKREPQFVEESNIRRDSPAHLANISFWCVWLSYLGASLVALFAPQSDHVLMLLIVGMP
jgi:hypothetical protein